MAESETNGVHEDGVEHIPRNHVNNDARRDVYNVYSPDGNYRTFAKGNPGRPKGSKDKRTQSLQDWMDAHPELDPVALRLQQLERCRIKLAQDEWSYATERLETEKLLNAAIADIMQYRHTKLRAVEHVGQLEIVQKLHDLDNMTDDQLRTLIGELEALPKQLPAGS